MKGVIVQIGEPKSIVLFNNGKIRAIPTPADCHVGMVVTVKLNDKLKIIAITLAAVFLVALGVFIGTTFHKGSKAASPILAAPAGRERQNDRVIDHGRQVQSVTVQEAKTLGEDTPVLLTGNLVESLGDEKYTFRDSTGDITVEIDRKLWRDLSVNASDQVEISGEIDIEKRQTIIDVKTVRKK